jgi:hypothetical protein
MQGHRAKRKSLRLPISFPVSCKQADNEKLGGRGTNLGTGGLAINTNSPIRTGEQLKVEFFVRGKLNPVNALGEVIWSQSNYDTPEPGESLFTAGIEFSKLESSFQGIILDYLLELFWREYLFGMEDIEGLLSEIENLPVQESRIIFHNFFFCLLFAEGGCPHQAMMERAYLIPQFITATDIVEYQNRCWSCGVYKLRQLAK